MPDPASSIGACVKYLPSVQRPALSERITAKPAEPVKPVSQVRSFHCSGKYSLMCGSAEKTVNASMLFCFISFRRESTFSLAVICKFLVLKVSDFGLNRKNNKGFCVCRQVCF